MLEKIRTLVASQRPRWRGLTPIRRVSEAENARKAWAPVAPLRRFRLDPSSRNRPRAA